MRVIENVRKGDRKKWYLMEHDPRWDEKIWSKRTNVRFCKRRMCWSLKPEGKRIRVRDNKLKFEDDSPNQICYM